LLRRSGIRDHAQAEFVGLRELQHRQAVAALGGTAQPRHRRFEIARSADALLQHDGKE
jgi:hypothetical protein